MDTEFEDDWQSGGGGFEGPAQAGPEGAPADMASEGSFDPSPSMFGASGDLPAAMDGGYSEPAGPTASQLAYGDGGGGVGQAVDTVTGFKDATDLVGDGLGWLAGGPAQGAEVEASGAGGVLGNAASAVSAGSNFAKAIDGFAAGDASTGTAQTLIGGLNAAGSVGVVPAGVAGAAMGMMVDGDKVAATPMFGTDGSTGKPLSPMDVAAHATVAAGDAGQNAFGGNPAMAGMANVAQVASEVGVGVPAFAAAATYDIGAGIIHAGQQAGSWLSGLASAAWNKLTAPDPQAGQVPRLAPDGQE